MVFPDPILVGDDQFFLQWKDTAYQKFNLTMNKIKFSLLLLAYLKSKFNDIILMMFSSKN